MNTWLRTFFVRAALSLWTHIHIRIIVTVNLMSWRSVSTASGLIINHESRIMTVTNRPTAPKGILGGRWGSEYSCDHEEMFRFLFKP